MTSIRTTVLRATFAGAVSLVALSSSQAFAQAVCVTTPLGVLDCEPDGPTAEINLPGQTGPVSVTLPDDYEGATTLLVESDGPITLDGNAVVATLLDDQPALDLTSGADITAQIDVLSTQGENATGALLTAVDSVVLTVDESVTTLGDEANGIDVTAGDANVTVGDVRTAGVGANGVNIVTASGPGVLTADLIDTSGDDAIGALLRATGDADVNVGVLQTGGDRAFGLDIASDPTACAALGAGSCDINAIASNVTTDGFGSIGALVNSAGRTTIGIGALQTGGDEAAGLDLSADPTACAALGTGSCDTAFTVQNLTTGGARAPGALVRAAGNVTGNVNVLTTNGEDSAGLDIASDPDACVILGAGGCANSFSVGQLTTNGDGSTGALIRAAGPTTANFTALETFGDDSTGVDIAADPEACGVLGIGACDTALTAGRISTTGDNSAGALLAVPADVTGDFGTVETLGLNSPAIAITGDPEACALLGTGGCDTTLSADRVTTQGADSGAVLINSPGEIVADIGLVNTGGGNSPGITIAPDPGACAILGDGACGVTLTGNGGTGPTVGTTGPNSPGVVITTPGPIDATVGPITVTGPGSDGINVIGTGCENVSVTATGPINATGIGINAQGGCGVQVRTLRGAPVRGGLAGINVVSGTGATVTVGDALSSGTGPALNADGAGAAAVVIDLTGAVTGRIDLTANADTLTNNGLFAAAGASDFGAGADLFTNNGVLSATGVVTLGGLETLANAGIVDLRNGVVGDVLTLPGAYSGSGGAALGVDVSAGTASDRLVVGGAATGSTVVLVSGDGSFVNGATVVDAGAGTSATAFVAPATAIGLTDYEVAFDAASNNFLLFGTPSDSAVGFGLLGGAAREMFYRSNEAVGAQLGAGGVAGEGPRIGRAFWIQPFGMIQDRDLTLDATVFGQPRSYALDSRQDWYGIQIGADLVGGEGVTLGLTGGYTSSRVELEASPLRLKAVSWNAGVYGRADLGAFFVRGLAKYESYDVDYRLASLGDLAELDGDGWGGWLEVGARLGSGGFFVEPAVSIEYVNLGFDGFATQGVGFDLAEADGLRGKAGARVGTVLDSGPTRLTLYAGAQAIHEFEGEDTLTLTSAGSTTAFVLPRTPTYGRATLGFSAAMGDMVHGFIEASGDFAGGVSGGGGRAGIAVRF